MKIIQICPYAMERPGGVQRHVRDLSIWLESQGHQSRIIAPPLPGKRPSRQNALIELGRSRSIGTHGTAFEISAAAPWVVRRTARELCRWGADIVHMHTPWTPMLAGQVWRQLKLPTVTTIHATLPDDFGGSLVDRYIRRSAKHYLTASQAIVTPSSTPLTHLRRFVPGTNAHILPPTVDLSLWYTASQTRDPETIHLVFLGRLETRKGILVLLKAWPQIAAARADIRLTIAGDGGLRDRVEAMVDDRLTYIGAPDDATAQNLLASADMFIAPATHGESYGLAVAEAMAAGAVPVAAGNEGYREVLGSEGASLIVAPGDQTALAEKVIELASDPSHLSAMRDWAKMRAKDTDVTVAGPRYLSLFKDVLGYS